MQTSVNLSPRATSGDRSTTRHVNKLELGSWPNAAQTNRRHSYSQSNISEVRRCRPSADDAV